jgi:hypothetical protein
VMHTFYVDPSVTAFDDLEVGDVVTVRFTESVVVQVRPDAKPTTLQDTTEAARTAGDANVIQQQKRIVIFEEVDSQGLFVTYRTEDNQRGIHPVLNKELLEGLRRGDRIEITLTLARAVSIEPKR